MPAPARTAAGSWFVWLDVLGLRLGRLCFVLSIVAWTCVDMFAWTCLDRPRRVWTGLPGHARSALWTPLPSVGVIRTRLLSVWHHRHTIVSSWNRWRTFTLFLALLARLCFVLASLAHLSLVLALVRRLLSWWPCMDGVVLCLGRRWAVAQPE